MHLYLRAIGFSEIEIEYEQKLINQAVNNAIANSAVFHHKKLGRGMILLKTSERTGIYVHGVYDGKTFQPQYYFPYLLSRFSADCEELTIERHSDKESYAVVCEEIKAGVTIIFYLQNVMDYLKFIEKDKFEQGKEDVFNIHNRCAKSKLPVKNKKVLLSAMSTGGMILLPLSKSKSQVKKYNDASQIRKNLIAAAKRGDEQAIESLTIDDLDTYNKLSKRIVYEDVFSIVDSSFMPCGVECDQYSVVGEILHIDIEKNSLTGEKVYIMALDCNEMKFDLVINECDLVGEPKAGRRFKGQVWLQGAVNFEE